MIGPLYLYDTANLRLLIKAAGQVSLIINWLIFLDWYQLKIDYLYFLWELMCVVPLYADRIRARASLASFLTMYRLPRPGFSILFLTGIRQADHA